MCLLNCVLSVRNEVDEIELGCVTSRTSANFLAAPKGRCPGKRRFQNIRAGGNAGYNESPEADHDRDRSFEGQDRSRNK